MSEVIADSGCAAALVEVRFREIYDITNKTVLVYIIAKCGRTDDINDIFQETYIELYHLLLKRGADYVTNEKALMLSLAKHKVSKYYTLRARLARFVSMRVTNEDGDELELSDAEFNAFVTEDFTANYATLETARQFLHGKAEDIQKIFYLKFSMDLSLQEIAAAMGLSESSVKNKLYRTLKELRKVVQI